MRRGGNSASARKVVRADKISDIRHLEHFPSDQELAGYIQLRQVYKDADDHLYWVEEMPTTADRRDLELPAVADFYHQLAEFTESRVGLVDVSAKRRSQGERDSIEGCLDTYSTLILRKERAYRELLQQGVLPDPAGFEQNFLFDGLNIKEGNQIHDLSQVGAQADGLISNICVSRSFVRYATEATANQLLHVPANNSPLRYRIYLNPRISRMLEIAGQLADGFDHEDLQVACQIINRAWEVSRKRGQILGVGTEGMVVYCNEHQIDRVLEVILECFEHNYEAFQDRSHPTLATPIAPGIAIASGEGFDTAKYSFNTHRSTIIAAAWEDFESQQDGLASTVSHQSIYAFKQVLTEVFRRHDIDPHNISFNDPAASYDII